MDLLLFLCLNCLTMCNNVVLQAKFLKACGTIPETPLEIRKLSEKCRDLSVHDGELEPLEFHSWFLDSSIEKQNLVLQPDQSPKPTKDCEDWVKGSDSPVHSPSR